jgi:tetratricopeptide (TPR) repeat protein
MKTILTLTTLLILVSCSSSRVDRKIDDSHWDSLADESFMRWGEGRLNSYGTSNHKVVGCYKGETKQTLVQFKKDFALKNDSPYYWLHIGNCYFIKEDWSKAEFYYKMTLDESKSQTSKAIALNNLGLIHFKYEQWEKGKEYLKQSMTLAPKFRVPRYNISQLYLQFGLYDKAIDTLSDSSFKDQKDIDVVFSLANAYLFKGDLKTSASYFALIPKDHLKREDIAATYALFLIRTGKVSEARLVMKERDRSHVPELSAISQKIEKLISSKVKED